MSVQTARLELSPPCREVVRRPRATDAIGASLRETFVVADRVPADWLEALDKLDRQS